MATSSSRVFFGAIADDFTGASDIAAMIARTGAPVSLHFGVESLSDVKFTNAFEVIALKCRTKPVSEAVEEAKAAYHWLKSKGAERFFWKYCSTFDSTPEGNIGPVAEALMDELNTRQVVYCPAFPQNGRSIYAGYLYVSDQLLSESSMKDHPLTPMRDANLMRLLKPQVKTPVGHIHFRTVKEGFSSVKERLKELAAQGVEHIIIDAVEDDHLSVIAGACQNMALVTGGSALAGALAPLYRKAGHVEFDENRSNLPQVDKTPLVLSGSCSEMTRKQVAHFSERYPSFKLDPVELAKGSNMLSAAKQWLAEQPLENPKMIYSSAEPDDVAIAQETLGSELAGTIVENALSDLAEHSLTLGMRQIIVAGGETSGAVMQSLGINNVEVGPEISPGVPWLFAHLEVENAAFALKSGNFGEEDFFVSAFQKL